MPEVNHNGKVYEVDEDGFLADPEKWDLDFVFHVKESEGIPELGEGHWKVIHYLRDYYKKNGAAPLIRVMTKVTGFRLKHIYELFPDGPRKGACRMAGLAKPNGCV